MMKLALALSSCAVAVTAAAQTISLGTSPIINTVAGTPQQSGYSGDGGPANQATMGTVYGVALDASGNYYIADLDNSVVRAVNTQTTAVTIAGVQIQPGDIATIAGTGTPGYSGDNGPATSAQIAAPYAVAVDKSGNIYIADDGNDVIRKVTTAGIISTFAGESANSIYACDYQGGYSGDGGPATQAMLNCPLGVAADGLGNVYIADTYNNVVRMVNPGGTISTVAGNGLNIDDCNGTAGYSGDGGPATQAQLNCVTGVSVDAAGNFYIADEDNAAIRVVNTQSNTITVAGVQILPGDINTVAGNGTQGYSGDGGAGNQAQLNSPWSSSVDALGNIFIADLDNYVVREVLSDGTISTYAGNGTSGYGGDGGPANQAEFSWAPGVAVNTTENLYIADATDYVIRMTTSGGSISQDFGQLPLNESRREGVQLLFDATITINSLQTSGDFSIPPQCGACNSTQRQSSGVLDVNRLHLPKRIAEQISKHGLSGSRSESRVHANIQREQCTGTFQAGDTCTIELEFTPTQPGPRSSQLVLSDSNSNLYAIGLTGTGSGSTLAFTPGMISDIAGNGTHGYTGDGGPATGAEFAEPLGVVRDGAGNLFIADGQSNVVRKVDTNGNIWTIAGNGTAGYSGDGGPATSAEMSFPFGLSMDSAENLYIADIGNSAIRKVDINGIITTVAGNGSFGYTGDGGSALAAQLGNPVGVAADNLGNFYIADTFNNVIRKVNQYGIITTVAGNGYGAGSGNWQDEGSVQGGYAGDGGPATQAELFLPFGIDLDSAGNLYISDSQNSIVREVNSGGTISTIAGECPNGTCQAGYSGDGGPATGAQLAFPVGVAFDSAGELFIVDAYNSAIRKVDVSGNIWTVAGDGPGSNVVKSQSESGFRWKSGNGTHNLTKTGHAFGMQGISGGNGVATSSPLDLPASVIVDNSGSFYVPDADAYVVWKVDVTTSLLAFGNELVGGASDPQSVTIVDAGNASLNLSQISVASGFTNVSAGQTACTTQNAINVGGNCGVAITFNPTETGSYNGSLTITDDAFNSPQSASLTGTGTVNLPVDTALGYLKAPPANLQVGGAVGTIEVGVYLSNSNLDTNSTASITVTISGPNNFSSIKSQQAVAGIATLDFSQVTLPAVGQYSVRATSGSLTPASVGIAASSAPGYSVSANPTSLTITAGNSGSATLTISPVGGYAGTVNFACSSLPAYSTCTFKPASVSLNGSNTPVTAQLTVDTSGANHAAKVEYPRSNHGSPFGPASLWFVQAGLAGLVVAGSANGRRKRSRQVWMGMALLILLVVTTLVATGCAGYSQGGNGNTSPSGAATPAGNYTSTVTASASGGTGMQHSVDIKITVVE
jgi:hypothetical protein